LISVVIVWKVINLGPVVAVYLQAEAVR
jgi:hypothetical protein